MASKAVLCGINNYETQPDLRGCINDVKNMHQLLTQNFGFNLDQIKELLDHQVTKVAFKKAWKWLLKDAQPGDNLVFHFSGHGSYMPDDNGDEESDPYDEVLCLYNMDFSNPDSYIRDDEWGKMMQEIPQGVLMTVVMDNCHAGTGTRAVLVDKKGSHHAMAVDLKASSKRSHDHIVNLLLNKNGDTATITLPSIDKEQYLEVLEDHNVVLSRFLPPPPEIQDQLIRIARVKGMKPKTKEAKNRLLLAACRDDQTAADAFIHGSFNGAFTYHLCQKLRSFPHLESQVLIEKVAQALRSSQFTQEPQHEGVNRPVIVLNQPPSTEPQVIHPSARIAPELEGENQRLLIQAYIKLLETLGGSAAARESSQLQVGNRQLVYVHGISQHTAGYSNNWWNALKQHVGTVFGNGSLNAERWEVIWSDLVNPRALFNLAHRDQLRREIMAVLEERRQQMVAVNTGGGQKARRAVMEARNVERGIGFAIDDFLVYMLDNDMRQRIIDRFIKVVKPLLEHNNQIDIVSHSWGTVVAYEALRQLETNTALPGRVGNFFTVGSALSILPVRSHLRNENKDGHRPTNVERWINLDAKGDLVGGMLSDKFDITHEYLNLEPTGCPRQFFGYGLSCAHSSYFHDSNLTVNRDIFARFIAGNGGEVRVRSSSQSSSGSYSGNNGDRIYDGKHTDIDESTMLSLCSHWTTGMSPWP
jgi:metacaspase-1